MLKKFGLIMLALALVFGLGLTGCGDDPVDEKNSFNKVTGITGVPTVGYVDVELTLSGTVTPANATNKAITWSLKDSTMDAGKVTLTGNKLTVTEAGDLTLIATVKNGAASDKDYAQNVPIKIEEPHLNFTVNGAVQKADVKGAGSEDKEAVVTYLNDMSGYKVVFLDSYGNSYAQFKVDLGDGLAIADYEKVKFSFQGVEGDVDHKNVYLGISETEYSGYKDFQSGPSASYSGDDKSKKDLEIDVTKITSPAAQELWVVFTIHADKDKNEKSTAFIVSNIEFVKGVKCSDCSNFPCTCCKCACVDECPATSKCACTPVLCCDSCKDDTCACAPSANTSLGDIVMGDLNNNSGNHHFIIDSAKRDALAGGQHFLLLETSVPTNTDGYGGFKLQFEMTYGGQQYQWKELTAIVDGWFSFSNKDGSDVIWVINLSALPNYDDLVENGLYDTAAKLIIGSNSNQIPDITGALVNSTYLVENELHEPDGAVALSTASWGFIVKKPK